VSAADYQQGFPYEIEEAVRSKSPEAWLEAFGRLLNPESPEGARRWVAEAPIRIDTDLHMASQTAMANWDADQFLDRIRAPTLMVASGKSLWLPPNVAERIAARIADCRLVFEDLASDRMMPLIAEFLGSEVAPQAQTDSRATPHSGMMAILFLDIAGSTEMTTQLGDAAYREKERRLDASLRQAIRDAGGAPVEGKVLGDGVMATFASAKDAIEAALRCQALGAGAALPLHGGIHAGDVIHEGSNVHGGAVQVAARIADASSPGEVLVSQTVRDLARTSAGVSFEDRGERELKGVGEPVRVWAVRGASAS
jgi:class 3 adenylate cyclase